MEHFLIVFLLSFHHSLWLHDNRRAFLNGPSDQLVNRCLWGDSFNVLNNRCVYRRTRSVNSD